MKVLLLNLPWTIDGRKGIRAGCNLPHLILPCENFLAPYPFSLAYATSELKENGFTVRAIDAIAEKISEEEVYSQINAYSPNLILAETSIASLENDLEIIKKIKKSYDVLIAIAYPSTMNGGKILRENKFIDFILFGEYELTLLDLCQKIEAEENYEKVKGIMFLRDNALVKNPKRPLASLDKLPWPNRSYFPIYKYNDEPEGMPFPNGKIISSRGSHYPTNMWPNILQIKNVRTRKIKDVADEMEFLASKGFKSIYFCDDVFNFDKKRMLDLAQELSVRRWNLPWAFRGRPDIIDKEILEKLKVTCLRAINFEIESANGILNNTDINKNQYIATKNIRLCQSLGINVHLSFIFGLPSETNESVKKNIEYALFINPDSVRFSILEHWPNRQLRENPLKASLTNQSAKGKKKTSEAAEILNDDELKSALKEAYGKWHWFKAQKMKQSKTSASGLFLSCLKENGLIYTINHTFRYLMNGRWKNKSIHDDKCDILLVNTPPWGDKPPLTFAYLESFIESKGYTTGFIDINLELFRRYPQYEQMWDKRNMDFWTNPKNFANIEKIYGPIINECIDQIIKHHSNVIGLSISDGKQLSTFDIIKKIKKRCTKKIIVGGTYFLINPPGKREQGLIDIIITGSDNNAILKVLENIKNEKPLSNIPGTIYPKDGKWIKVKEELALPTLKEYPYPKYRNFKLDLYKNTDIPSEWTHGCIAKCVFCTWTIAGTNFMHRDPQNIFDEIKYNYEINNIHHVTLYDYAINSNIKMLEEVCDMLIDSNVRVTWSGPAIPRKEMTLDLLKKMKKAGCIRLEYGIETGSEKIRRLMRKIPSVQEAEEVLRNTKKAGITTMIMIVAGFPGETEEDFNLTLSYLKRNKEYIDFVRQVSSLSIPPGSYIERNMEQFGIYLPKNAENFYHWKSKEGSTLEMRERRAKQAISLIESLGIPMDEVLHTFNESKQRVFEI